MHLESDLLRTFLAVAESHSFTAAADAVGRTQSAVSMQMKKLEDVVGTSLFTRGPRGVALTARAETLVRDARRIVTLLDRTMAELQAPPLGGAVSIGLPEEYGQTMLATALRSFAAHPHVEVTIRYGISSENLARLREGRLDLAVIFEWHEDYGGEVMLSDPTVWVSSERYAPHELRPVPIAVRAGTHWCREDAIAALDNARIPYRVAYTSESSGGVTLAASTGLAIAPVSRSSIPPGCRELTEAEGYGTIDRSRVVLHRNPRAVGEAVDGLADAVRDAFAALRR